MKIFRDIEYLKRIIKEEFQGNINSLEVIPSREGIIFKDDKVIYKCLTIFTEQTEMMKTVLSKENSTSSEIVSLHRDFIDTNQYLIHQYLKLKALSESIKKCCPIRIVEFNPYLIKDIIIIKMPFIKSIDYYGGYEEELIDLLKDFKKIKWISTDIKPQNLRINETNNEFIFFDIGFFFIPYYEELFRTMCRRAFVCLKFTNENNVKTLLKSVNNDETFHMLDNPMENQQEFIKFYNKINLE